MSWRPGVDVGGTFTDFVAVDSRTGKTISFKVPSTPADPAAAVMEGVRELADLHAVPAPDIAYFVHGTTLGVNTLITRSGARTGLLTTRGFGDVLEMARLRLPDPGNFSVDKPRPLVPRNQVVEIDERMMTDGSILRPLDIPAAMSQVERLVAAGVDAIAVCLLHSYRNPAHELELSAEIRARYPDLFVCSSAEIWRQHREYERTVVTAINAYIGPRLDEYYRHLATEVGELGLQAPLLTTKSNGGIMSAAAARQVPVEALFSGPASGAVAALHSGVSAGASALIGFDMGGTSAEVCVMAGDIDYSTESVVEQMPVLIPAVDIVSIGAGGGSIAWMDPSGVLKVGPDSAGARPGPVCYGWGGRRPTVTDAYVHLGIIDPHQFNGSRLTLRPDLAAAALAQLDEQVGLTADQTAEGILTVATANMHAQLMPMLAARGVDGTDFSLIAYGGAGPTHAALLAREAGIKQVIIPPSPGTLCAAGCLLSDLKRDQIHTVGRATAAYPIEELRTLLADLERLGRTWVADQRAPIDRIDVERVAELRYVGQSFEIPVKLGTDGELGSWDAVHTLFHARYDAIYGTHDPDAPLEVISVRVTVCGVVPKQAIHQSPALTGALAPPSRRAVRLDGREQSALVLPRHTIVGGESWPGPVIVEAPDTTVLVPAGFTLTAGAAGSLILKEQA